MQILEYIIQHYTLFLGGAILILLAIIGYYADKTNFGQGKNSPKTKDANNFDELDKNLINSQFTNNISLHKENTASVESNTLDSNNTTVENQETVTQNLVVDSSLVDNVSFDQETNLGLNQENQTVSNLVEENDQNTSSLEIKSESVNSNNENQMQNVELNLDSTENSSPNEIINLGQEDIKQVKKIKTSSKNILSNEEIKNFNDEFDMLLPKKELISDDLLSDIDDLELGKTKKLDLSDIPDLDDIELPKIKNLVNQEEDIWKF